MARHTAVVAAAHNPVLDDPFAQFAPLLREHPVALVGLLGLRAGDPDHGYDAHAGLLAALRRADAEEAGRVLAVELESTRARLLGT
ncbi:FCD domain-containing protein [Kitasatospora sp. NPDC048722]|uniref:FCD domain-containing protein n=1 Tax=Kitasatospora sp. NPDC048722 TaxID=3155639 RepID=UPI0033D9DB77